jgi:hypothetical protein
MEARSPLYVDEATRAALTFFSAHEAEDGESEGIEMRVMAGLICWEDASATGVSGLDFVRKCARKADSVFFSGIPSEVQALYDYLMPTLGDEIWSLFTLFLHENSPSSQFLAFNVATALLERVLQDLTSVRSEESAAVSSSDRKKRRGGALLSIILEDIDKLLEREVGCAVVKLLRIMLLPDNGGLNVRNLTWHGFLAPNELPRCLVSLTVMILLDVKRSFVSTNVEPPDNSSSADPMMSLPGVLDAIWASRPPDLSTYLEPFMHQSELFVDRANSEMGLNRGHIDLAHAALRELDQNSSALRFKVFMLPLLEHLIRIAFVNVNNHAAHSVSKIATANEYYATLDGFGQRSIHQLLLDPDILLPESCRALSEGAASAPVPNLLYQHFPIGAINILLDLLVHETGPRIRSALCHASSGAFSDLLIGHDGAVEIEKSLDSGSILLLVTFVALCCTKFPQAEDTHEWVTSCVSFVADYTVPIFHPLNQLHSVILHTSLNFDAAFEAAAFRIVEIEISEDVPREATMKVTIGTDSSCVQMTDSSERLVLDTSRSSTFAPKLADILTNAIDGVGIEGPSLRDDGIFSLGGKLDVILLRLARSIDPHGLARDENNRCINSEGIDGGLTESQSSGPSWDTTSLSSIGAAIDIFTIAGRAANALTERVTWAEEKVLSRSARERLRRLYASTLILTRPLLAAMKLVLFLTLKLSLKTVPDASKRNRCVGKLLSALTSLSCCLLPSSNTRAQVTAPVNPETPTKGYEQTIPQFVTFLQSRHFREISEFLNE